MPEVSTTATTTTAEAVVTTPAAPAGVETQSINTQVETTQTKPSAANTQTTAEVEVVKATPPVKPTEAQLASKIDYDEMISKHIDGTITPEEIASIEKAGLSVSQFEAMSNAQKNIQLANNNTLYSLVGGQENYEGLKEFAAENLGEDEIAGFNSALRSGNMKIAEIAVLGLKALAEKVNGAPAQIRIGSNGESTAGAIQAYSSQQDLIKDMNSRKYRVDPAFKKEVDARRNKSGF